MSLGSQEVSYRNNINGEKMNIIKGLKGILGSCNFCNRSNYYIVYEISGKSISIRICNNCLKNIRSKL